jgi:signal transduction histidine kinase
MEKGTESRILVVNDTPDQVEIINFLLRRAGYTVLTARDGREGYDVARQEHPDLIISDISMPNMDGIEMCRLVREQPELCLTPLLLVSANQKGSKPAIRGIKAGADDYLEAPYDPDLLIAKVARLLERKRLEETFNSNVEQLRQAQKFEALELLAGSVAHDFNNLLTTINGHSDLILRKLKEEDPLRIHIQEIQRASERAALLTRQLIIFSRKQVRHPNALDLNSVVSGMEKMLRRLIGDDIEMRTVLEPRPAVIRADSDQIEQVLMNLAANARDAMPQGGEMIIKTENVYLDEEYARRHIAVKSGPYVMMSVSDTGTGIDAETEARIFDPFFTTKIAGKATGFGLSIVYGIVRQSGGHIRLHSEDGRGTTFNVYLPRLDEDAQ